MTTTLPAGLGLLGIDHVGIAVPDLDAAISFYERVFGMRATHRESYPEQGLLEAMLATGPDPDGPAVQLLASSREDSTIGRFLRDRGPGIQQLALRVSDVDEAARHLTAVGTPPLLAQAARGTAGSLVNFVHPRHTGGVLIELVQRA